MPLVQWEHEESEMALRYKRTGLVLMLFIPPARNRTPAVSTSPHPCETVKQWVPARVRVYAKDALTREAIRARRQYSASIALPWLIQFRP